MISQKYRFHGRNALNRVYKQSRLVRSSAISIRYTEIHKGQYRCAVVVSKKVHKSAVIRNKIRRRIYEVIRQAGPRLAPVDLVVTVFSEKVFMMPYADLEHELHKLLAQTGVFNNTEHR